MRTLAELSTLLKSGKTSSRELVEQALDRIEDPSGEGSRAFVKVYADLARAEADLSDALLRHGRPRSHVEGVPISVKDLFDVAGDVTKAGSIALSHSPPAASDAIAVARLRAAGAVLLGRTNMVEFAFGGTGLNPHYGTPKNPFDRATGRLPGGSSSGAGVAVADGMGAMALGSDTRGSVRIPAALCGVTGFKPTQERVPRAGAFPLSYTLDSVGPLAPSVACVRTWDGILSAAPSTDTREVMPARGLRLLVPRSSLFDDLDSAVASAFERAVSRLSECGAVVSERSADIFTRAQELFKNGGFAAAEAFHVHRHLLETQEAEVDPRIAKRLWSGRDFAAVDYIDLAFRRRALQREAQALCAPFDALIYPTVAITAPVIADTFASDEVFVRTNLLLLRNTGLANILDGCALTIPCHPQGSAPVGLTVAGLWGSDAHVLSVGEAVEAALARAP